MKKEMLINCLQSEEIRIAIVENGVLEELYVERASHESYVGNIYKGRVVNIEPSIQAAFVDFGVGRNGFLHVSDVEPAYYRHIEQQSHGRRGDRDRGGRDRGGRDRGGRGGRDRGDRGGRGRPQPRYDDPSAPPRQYGRPPVGPEERDELLGQPGETPPMSHELPPAPPEADGPDIIVEEIYDEPDEFYQPEAPVAAQSDSEEMREPMTEMREPTGLSEDWPAPMELPAEPIAEAPPSFAPVEAPEQPHAELPVEEAPKAEETPPPESADEKEDDADEPKTKRKTPSRGKGKTAKPRKPRKRTAAEESAKEPKPRPMDSSERRTGADDPSLGPIEPRPAPREDLSDDDLSFSRAPVRRRQRGTPSRSSRRSPSRHRLSNPSPMKRSSFRKRISSRAKE